MSKKEKTKNVEKVEKKQNANLPKKFKRKHMWWRYTLVFLGGTVFAVGGTLAGTAIYATTVPVSNVTNAIPDEYKGLLSFVGDPESETLYSTVMKFLTKEITVDTITESIDLADVIPSNLLPGNLYLKMCYYKTDSSSSSQSSSKAFNFKEGNEESSSIPDGYEPISLYMLINGKMSSTDSTPFSFVDNLMNGIVISDILSADQISASSLLNAIKDCNLNNIQDTVMDTPLSTLMGSTSGVLAALGNLTINDLTSDNAMNLITVADILNVDSSSDRMMQLIAFGKDQEGNIDYNNKRTVADLSNLGNVVNSFTLGDVITIDSSNKLLSALKNITIGNLATEAQTTLMDMPIKNLTTSTGGIMDSIGELSMNDLMADDATSKLYVADILNIDSNSDRMMQLIAFGKNEDKTINYNDKRSVADLANLNTIIDDLFIDDIIAIDTTDPILNAISGLKISELATEAKNRVMGCTISELTGSTDGIMAAIGNLTVEDLTKPGVKSQIKVADIMGADESSDKMIKLLCFGKNEDGTFNYSNKRSIADLDNLKSIIDGFVIDDLITIDPTNPVLAAISGSRIDELSTKIANIKVSDTFPNSDNGFIKWLIEEDGDPKVSDIDSEIAKAPLSCLLDTSTLTGVAGDILKSIKDSPVGQLGSAFASVKLVDALKSEIYDDAGNMNNTWKYMLYENINDQTSQTYKAYTLNNFSALTTNMKNNMKYATIRMLVDDGFISSIDSTKLNSTIPFSSNTKLVGDMTLSEFISAVLG